MFASLGSEDRVLVLGASGWLGRTFLSLLPSEVPTVAVGGVANPLTPWSVDLVERFEPTVVANFAFLTPSRLEELGAERYTATNRHLTARLLHTLALPTVRFGLTVSSGAAASGVRDHQSPSVAHYGSLKAEEEEAALQHVAAERSVVVARAYSLSGGLVTRPWDYAFSSFILQARTGHIAVESSGLVWRRYTAAADFLAVATARGLAGWSGILESGGELIEMGALAQRIADLVNPGAAVERRLGPGVEPATYASDGTSWIEACRRADYDPLTLDEQILAAEMGLRAVRTPTDC